jgi:hypothetical protein
LPQLGEAVPAAPIGTCEELASRIGSVPDTTIGVIFKVPPSTLPLSNGAAFTLGLDIDQTLLELFATDATYTESGMSFMTPPDASNLSQVRARGGKGARVPRRQRPDLLDRRQQAVVRRDEVTKRRRQSARGDLDACQEFRSRPRCLNTRRSHPISRTA